MGPNRQNWCFPHSAQEVIDAIERKEANLANAMDTAIDDDQLAEKTLSEYREKLRQAGIDQWQLVLPPGRYGSYGSYGNMREGIKLRQSRIAKELLTLGEWRRALEHDVAKNPKRTFKLAKDDLDFFGMYIDVDIFKANSE